MKVADGIVIRQATVLGQFKRRLAIEIALMNSGREGLNQSLQQGKIDLPPAAAARATSTGKMKRKVVAQIRKCGCIGVHAKKKI